MFFCMAAWPSHSGMIVILGPTALQLAPAGGGCGAVAIGPTGQLAPFQADLASAQHLTPPLGAHHDNVIIIKSTLPMVITQLLIIHRVK